MHQLNLPAYPFKYKFIQQRKYIFDSFRKKYVVLTPEENVRQHFAQYLVNEKAYPSSLIAIEFFLHVGELQRRCDMVVFGRNGKPQVIVECKAPSINLTPDVFDQVTRYNRILACPLLIVTNGMKHYCCLVDLGMGTWKFIPSIPAYHEILGDTGLIS